MTGQERIYSRLSDPAILMDPAAAEQPNQLCLSADEAIEDTGQDSPDTASGRRENGRQLSA
jgi:hypothetical protein